VPTWVHAWKDLQDHRCRNLNQRITITSVSHTIYTKRQHYSSVISCSPSRRSFTSRSDQPRPAAGETLPNAPCEKPTRGSLWPFGLGIKHASPRPSQVHTSCTSSHASFPASEGSESAFVTYLTISHRQLLVQADATSMKSH
jgi:hypothetical protein